MFNIKSLDEKDSQQEYDLIKGHFEHIKRGILKKNKSEVCAFGERIERELENQFIKGENIFDSNIIFSPVNEQNCKNINI